jgi:hypothetical protein
MPTDLTYIVATYSQVYPSMSMIAYCPHNNYLTCYYSMNLENGWD